MESILFKLKLKLKFEKLFFFAEESEHQSAVPGLFERVYEVGSRRVALHKRNGGRGTQS